MPFTALCLMTSLPRLHYENRNMRSTVCSCLNIQSCGKHADNFVLKSEQEQVSGHYNLVGIAYIGLRSGCAFDQLS